MPTAKKDEVNIVEIESEGYNKEKVLSIYNGVGFYEHAFCTFLGQRTVNGSLLEPMCYIKHLTVSRRRGVFLDTLRLSKAGNKLICHDSRLLYLVH